MHFSIAKCRILLHVAIIFSLVSGQIIPLSCSDLISSPSLREVSYVAKSESPKISSELNATPDLYEINHPDVLSFSTEKAHYFLHGADHDVKTVIPSDILEAIDGITLEITPMVYEMSYHQKIISQATQTNDIFRSAKQFNKSIFTINLPWKSRYSEAIKRHENEYYRKYRKDFIVKYLSSTMFDAMTMSTPLVLFIVTNSFWFIPLSMASISYFALKVVLAVHKDGITNKSIMKILGYFSLFRFYTIVQGLQSAVMAYKIEEFIAPELTHRIGRKPVIFVEAGYAHIDIFAYLRHKWLRNSVIMFHRLWNFVFLDGSYINKVGEINFSPKFNDDQLGQTMKAGAPEFGNKFVYTIGNLRPESPLSTHKDYTIGSSL